MLVLQGWGGQLLHVPPKEEFKGNIMSILFHLFHVISFPVGMVKLIHDSMLQWQ